MISQEDKDILDKWFKTHTLEELIDELIKAGFKPNDTVKID